MDDEKILEVVPVTWKKGVFKQEPWAVIITDKRMLFTKWTQGLFKKEAEKRAEETKEAGGGKLKQFFSQLGAGFTYYKKYYDMAPEEIIKEHSENFALTPNDVNSITLKRGREKRGAIINVKYKVNIGGSDIDDVETPHELLINTKTGRIVLTFNTNYSKVRSALSQAFNV